MNISKCPNCGMPMESSNYYLHGMTIKCRYCSYSGLHLNAGVCLYDKIKVKQVEEYQDAFNTQLNSESIFSKFALLGLFSFIASVWAVDMRSFALVSLIGFLMFSVFYCFVRIRHST